MRGILTKTEANNLEALYLDNHGRTDIPDDVAVALAEVVNSNNLLHDQITTAVHALRRIDPYVDLDGAITLPRYDVERVINTLLKESKT